MIPLLALLAVSFTGNALTLTQASSSRLDNQDPLFAPLWSSFSNLQRNQLLTGGTIPLRDVSRQTIEAISRAGQMRENATIGTWVRRGFAPESEADYADFEKIKHVKWGTVLNTAMHSSSSRPADLAASFPAHIDPAAKVWLEKSTVPYVEWEGGIFSPAQLASITDHFASFRGLIKEVEMTILRVHCDVGGGREFLFESKSARPGPVISHSPKEWPKNLLKKISLQKEFSKWHSGG